MSLIENKKEYFVKQGTCFFRRSDTTAIVPYMFFGFDVGATSTSECTDRRIQVWKTVKDFSILYAINKYQNENNPINEWRFSSLPDIYLKKYPEVIKVDHIDVKRTDNQIRRNLLAILKAEKYFGWVTSLENTGYMEMFLFGEIIPELIEFICHANETNEKLYDCDYFSKSNII